MSIRTTAAVVAFAAATAIIGAGSASAFPGIDWDILPSGSATLDLGSSSGSGTGSMSGSVDADFGSGVGPSGGSVDGDTGTARISGSSYLPR
ncbi:hypothetical protein [Nocardia camponoti]|uniref:Uncharacterized protein n=1 Tax=Nocardia camponoti TaxID=1616106 RepID=A0A917V886_9NOCA|nr:hypothetical protein [Nocardia camponoti]GGK48333.1 hypothetical protein GCM10011591_19630 [Nocardia camponoti]